MEAEPMYEGNSSGDSKTPPASNEPAKATGNVTVRLLISNSAAGSIIGKGGQTISDFQTESNARIQLSRAQEYFPGTTDRVVLLTGSVPGVLTALHLIITKLMSDGPTNGDGNEQQNPSIRLAIPGPCAGALIGKGGATIKAFVEDSGAIIKLSPQEQSVPGVNERIVTLQGTGEQLLRAAALIITKLAEDANYAVLSAVPIPYSLGSTSNRGGNRRVDDSVMRHGQNVTTSVVVAVPDEHVGAVVGKSGKTINEIQAVTNTRIKVSDRGDFLPGTNQRAVTISGSSEDVQIAQMLVTRKVQASVSGES